MKSKISDLNFTGFKNVRNFVFLYRAIFFILGLAGISITGVLVLFNISTAGNVEFLTRTSIEHAATAFKNLERNTINTLSATLEGLMSNPEIATRFYTRNAAGLYKFTRPVLDHLRVQNGISHWYFITQEPEKRCFLRVHNPGIRNDTITRITLDNCIKSKRLSVGKELGKTALALRAVHPYSYRGQVIGYIELAVDMIYLFRQLTLHTGNEYGLLVNKAYLNKKKWDSVIEARHVRNNWNDLDHFLLVGQTHGTHKYGFVTKDMEELETIPAEGAVLELFSRRGKHFVRGVFPFYDAKRRKIGGIFVVKDITRIYTSLDSEKQKIVTLLIGFMAVVTLLMVFFHKRAEKELRRYRTKLEDTVNDTTAEIRESNRKLNIEIQEHRIISEALENECRAREEAEKKQLNAVKTAEQSARLASIGVMTAGITHEINQPLNAIKVTADSIQYWQKRNPGKLPEPFPDQLSIISKSVIRIVEIIQHMRDFWMVPDNPAVAVVCLNKAVKNALSLTHRQLHAHRIKDSFEKDFSSLMVEGNLIHFEQIVINLLINAINALDKRASSDKSIHMKTYTDKATQEAVLVIQDNGPGLPVENMEKLLDPIFSTNQTNGGMGLGLAIVKRYVDRYNGTIDAANHRDDEDRVAGARFTLKFPLHKKKSKHNLNQGALRS